MPLAGVLGEVPLTQSGLALPLAELALLGCAALACPALCCGCCCPAAVGREGSDPAGLSAWLGCALQGTLQHHVLLPQLSCWAGSCLLSTFRP